MEDHNLPRKLRTYLLQALFQIYHIREHHADSSMRDPTNGSTFSSRPKLTASTLANAQLLWLCPSQGLPPLTHSPGLGGHTGHLGGGLPHGADAG